MPVHPKVVADLQVGLEARERAEHLWRAIDGLSEKLRIVIVLAGIQGHDIKEVAALLELPEGTVKSRLFCRTAATEGRTVMDGTGPRQPLSDSQLDRELESALGVEPSPEFLARVRTRVAGEPAVSLWRQALWGRGVQPSLAMALVGVLLAVIVPRLMRNDERPIERVAARPADVRFIRPAEKMPPVSRDPIAVRVVRQSAPTGLANEVPLRLSQPLFSEDERRALVQLIAGVEEGRLPPVVAEPATAVPAQPDVRTALNIEPLVIDPLPLLALVPKEGEGQW